MPIERVVVDASPLITLFRAGYQLLLPHVLGGGWRLMQRPSAIVVAGWCSFCAYASVVARACIAIRRLRSALWSQIL